MFNFNDEGDYVDSVWTIEKKAYSRLKTLLREFFNDEESDEFKEITNKAKKLLKQTLNEDILQEVYRLGESLNLLNYTLDQRFYIREKILNSIL